MFCCDWILRCSNGLFASDNLCGADEIIKRPKREIGLLYIVHKACLSMWAPLVLVAAVTVGLCCNWVSVLVCCCACDVPEDVYVTKGESEMLWLIPLHSAVSSGRMCRNKWKTLRTRSRTPPFWHSKKLLVTKYCSFYVCLLTSCCFDDCLHYFSYFIICIFCKQCTFMF